MGFLNAIGDLLGGVQAVEMQDKCGPDWRMKKAAEDFALQQRQADEARAAEDFRRTQEEADITGMAEASLAPGATAESVAVGIKPDVQGARRKFQLDRAAGRSAQSKSSLASQKANTDWMLRQMAGDQRLEQIDAAGGEAQELARIKAEIDAGRKLSPRDQAMLASAEKRAAARGGGSGGGGGRPQLRLVSDGQGGAEYRWIYPGETAAGAPTATQRETAGMAVSVDDALSRMEKLATDVSYGPIEGRASLAFQSQYPGGPEMEFDALKNRLIDLAYIQSGKQINRLEIELKINQLVNRAKGNLPKQVRLAKDYINSALLPYRRSGAVKPTPGGGGGAPQPIRSQAGWDALPSGAKYLGSDGRGRTKP